MLMFVSLILGNTITSTYPPFSWIGLFQLSFPFTFFFFAWALERRSETYDDPTPRALLFVVLNSLGLAFAALLFAGFRSPVMVLFPWPIVVSGTLLRPRHSMAVGVGIILFFLLLMLFQLLGIYTPLFTPGREYCLLIGQLFMAIVAFPTLTLLVYFIKTHVQKMMGDLEENTVQLELNATILDNTDSGILVADAQGKIIHLNPALLAMTGQKEGQILNRDLYTFQKHLFVDRSLDEVFQSVRATGVWQREIETKTAGGDSLNLGVTVNGVQGSSGEIEHWIFLFSDITKMRRAESASEAKSQFLAHMSHEIRTPMNGVIGMTQLALESRPNPEMVHYLKTIQSSANNLVNILNDILDVSKIEAGQVLLEEHPFKLLDVVQTSITMFEYMAREKAIQLSFSLSPELPEVLVGDATRIKQLLLNLLGNGVKFTDEGEVHLTITLEESFPTGYTVLFAVRDTGKGIAPEKLETIFERFTQEDSTITRRYGGTGLGLAITKGLVAAMEGSLKVESTLGEGSCFSFSIPLRKASLAEIKEASTGQMSVAKSSQVLSLLVVDDNETNRQLTTLALTKHEHVVREAENGLEALASLAASRYDAVIMDLQMPHMDGNTAIRIIRKLEQGRLDERIPDPLRTPLLKNLEGGHLPIIAVTGYPMGEDALPSPAVGMDDYLVKPLVQETLLQALYRLLGSPTPAAPLSPPEGAEPKKTESDSSQSESSRVRALRWLRSQHGMGQRESEELLEESAQLVQEGLKELRSLLGTDQFEQGAEKAHFLKGGLLALGLKEEAARAKIIERICLGKEDGVLGDEILSIERSVQNLE